MSTSPRSAWVVVGGWKMRVRTVGHASPAIVILNGFAAEGDVLVPLQQRLAVSRRTISLDLSGLRSSPGHIRVITMRDYASLVAEAVRTETDGPIDLIGFSWGGAVAQQLAHDDPEFVRKLVLVNTLHGRTSRPPSPLAFAMACLVAANVPLGVRRRLARVAYGGAPRPGCSSDIELLAASALRLPRCMAAFQQALALLTWSSLGWLDQVRHETLIVAATDDPLVPIGNAVTLASKLPRSTLKCISGAGHLWPLECPAEAADLILEYLAS